MNKNYEKYFNQQAIDLARWSLAELYFGNRIKASKLNKIANKMEEKYRRERNILSNADYYEKKGFGKFAERPFFTSEEPVVEGIVRGYTKEELPHLLN